MFTVKTYTNAHVTFVMFSHLFFCLHVTSEMLTYFYNINWNLLIHFSVVQCQLVISNMLHRDLQAILQGVAKYL